MTGEDEEAVSILLAFPMLTETTWTEVFESLRDMANQLLEAQNPAAGMSIGSDKERAPQGVVIASEKPNDPDPGMLPFVFTVAELNGSPLLRNFGRLIDAAEAEVAEETDRLEPREGNDAEAHE